LAVNDRRYIIIINFQHNKKASRTNGRLECFYAQIFKVKPFNKLLLVRCVPDFLSILEDCTVR
jgi:predicted SnoaL-like aldol condensation-catalyzing enzyme